MGSSSFLAVNGSDHRHLYLMTAAAAVAVAVPVWWSRRSPRRRRRLFRSWSFTSKGLCWGVFPPATQAPATIINTALYFDRDSMPSPQELVDTVITPLLQYERLANVPPYYQPPPEDKKEDDATFDPHELVRTLSVPVPDPQKDPDGETALHETIYGLLEESLERTRLPWWEVVRLVPATAVGRSVCLLRVHHCLGDGLSLVAVFDKIITTLDGKPSESHVTKALLHKKPAGHHSRSSHPTLWQSIGSLLRAVVHVVGLSSSPLDAPTVFFKRHPRLQYSGRRQITLFPNVPLAYLKLLKNTYNKTHPNQPVTLNDILMCVISQAIYDYGRAHDDPLLRDHPAAKAQAIQCRALLPASLPRSPQSLQDPTSALTNQFCMVSADLSVGSTGVLDRLAAIQTTTRFLKTSPRAYVQLWLQNHIVSRLPHFVGRQTALDIFSRHTLVLTNVPGPPETCCIAQHPVRALQLFFVNVIPQVDLVSYAGTVYGNLVYDPAALPDGPSMAHLYARALVALGEALELDPGDIPDDLVPAAATG